MSLIIKTAACGILGAILAVTIKAQRREMALLVSLAACAVILLPGIKSFGTILEKLEEYQNLAGIDKGMLHSLLKVCGISVLTNLTAVFCREAGESGIGNTVELCGGIGAFCAALPMVNVVFDLLQELLGG